MTTKKIRNLTALLAAAAIAGGAAAWYIFGSVALLNYETGFFSALLVVAASAFGYRQMVQGSAESSPHHELQDETERIDDRFGLWEEDLPQEQDAAKVLKEERSRLKEKRPGLKSLLKSAKPALSLYRLGAYAVLLYAVYRLVSAGVFDPIPYLAGAGAAPLITAAALWRMNRS